MCFTWFEFDTEHRWLQARKKGIGASESAALLGYGFAGQNALTVYADKVADDEPEPEIPPMSSPPNLSELGPRLDFQAAQSAKADRLLIGKIIEKSVVEIFQIETGLQVSRPPDGKYHLCQSDAHPFMLATPDGRIVGQNAGLEIKNIDTYSQWEWKDDQTPDKYAIQCQHQMAVTGWDRIYLYALAGGSRTILRIIERDQEFIDILIAGNAAFWQRVVDRNPIPYVDGTEASTEGVKRLYRRDNGKSIVLSTEFEAMADELETLVSQEKAITEQIDAIKNRIKLEMGEAEIAYLRNGAEFHWKTITVNYKAKAAFTTTQRRFTRKG